MIGPASAGRPPSLPKSRRDDRKPEIAALPFFILERNPDRKDK
jgi:hypothetical protein